MVKLVIPWIILCSAVSVCLQTKRPPPQSVTTVVQAPVNKPSDAQKKKPPPVVSTQVPDPLPQVNPGPQRTSIQIIADKRVVRRGELVIFRLEPEALVYHTPYRFEFDFNEGARETLDRTRRFVQHRFTSIGPRTVSAFAIAPPGVAPDEEGIDPITIRVMQVNLSAKPLSTEVGIPVSFVATPIAKDPSLRYRFSFGDDKQTDWQTSNEASHSYTASGPYKPTVEVGFVDNNGPPTSCDSNSSDDINVTLPALTSLVLRVTPGRVKTNEVVNLSASFPANRRQIQYRFDFGDGQTSDWQDSSAIEHRYSVANTYEPSVEVRGLIDGIEYPLIKSPRRRITVDGVAVVGPSPLGRPSEVPTPPPQDWPWYFIPILICILVVTGFLFLTIFCIAAYKIYQWAFPPEPMFVPHIDVGTATTDHGGSTQLIAFELHWDPNMTSGIYGVLPNGPGLIASERSHP